MKQNIPLPLQQQIFLYAALSLASLAAGVSILFFLMGITALPFLLFSVIAAINAWRIYYAAVNGFCVILKGTVLKVERSPILRRTRAILAEVDGKALRIVLHRRLKAPRDSDSITIYAYDDTPIYEWKSVHQLSSYLALTIGDAASG